MVSLHQSYMSTDIQATMHTLSLAPPDEQWCMDMGATSHMIANRGGSGHNIPVIGHGNALLL
jgi:hypothetical protein